MDGKLEKGSVVGVGLGQRIAGRRGDGEAARLVALRYEDVEPLAWEELASAISACRKPRWERSRQYVEAVFVTDVEPESLDAVVDVRHLGDGGRVHIVVPGFAGGALLVAEDRFGRSRCGHAAAAARCSGLGDEAQCRRLAEEMAGSNAHSIRECRVEEKPERVGTVGLCGGAALLINCELSMSALTKPVILERSAAANPAPAQHGGVSCACIISFQ